MHHNRNSRFAILLLGLLTGIGAALALPKQSTHGTLQALPAPKPFKVKIDGVLAEGEWDKRGRMYVYNALKIRRKYSVEVFAMWDAGALYLGLHFKDPTPMLNNVDAANAPYDGWQADGFQARFTTDYNQIHMDAWYSSRADMTVGSLSYHRPLNTGNSKLVRAKGKSVRDKSGFAIAFKMDADKKGYVQEMRIPWKLLYRRVPVIQGGLKFRFTGEYFWGTPAGIKWPKVLWSDPINPKNPVRIVVYQSPHIWGTLELLAKGELAKGDVEAEEAEDKLQGPIPIRVEVPRNAKRFSLVIDDAAGRRVRNLASHAEVKTYLCEGGGKKRLIEVAWDARMEGGWDKERSLFLGDYVKPGRYIARILVHEGVGVIHAGSFYNPGAPPWPTASGSGSWLSDHAPPADLALLAPNARTKGRVLLMASIAESGVAFIGLDREGRKIWQWTRNTAHMFAVAGGAKYGYFAFSYVGKPYLGRLNPDTGIQVKFGNGKEDLPLPGTPTGLAVRGKRLAVAIKDQGILIYDAESGAQLKNVPLKSVRSLAFTSKGFLIGLTGAKMFIADIDRGSTITFAISGIARPAAITCDSKGRLYVSDPATQTVKVFSRIAAKTKLRQIVGKPGGRPPGPYNPLQMATPLDLAVDERPDGTRHLWCIENNNRLRRIVVWDLGKKKPFRKPKATIVRDYIGGTGYCGTGGLLSDNIPDMGIINGVIYKIDYPNYDYKPVQVMGGGPDPEPGKAALFAPGRYAQGAYFGNGYHFISKASGRKVEYFIEGGSLPTVYIRRGDRWHCVAAIGRRDHGVRFPATFPKPKKDDNLFCWNDLNRDGYQQASELAWASVGHPHTFRHRMWSYRCDRNLAWYHSGFAFKPVRFARDGAPVYDLNKAERLPGELGQRQHYGDIYRTRFGYVLQARKPGYRDPNRVIHGLIQLEGYDQAGKLRWTYPAYWHSVHGAFTAPMAIPGVIMGVLKVSGIIHMDGYDIISLRGNIGQEFLIRDDGLYVAELFTDQRMAPATLPDNERIAGKPINDTSLGGEPFSGWIARQDDAKVRLTYGLNDVRIAEVVGLEAVKVLPPQKLELTPADIARAREFVPRTAAKQRTEYEIVKGRPFSFRQELQFGDPAISIRAGRDEVAKARLRYDQQNLYVAWHVTDKTPLHNLGNAPALAFKSGDCVSLFIAPEGKYDPNILGGTRVLLAPLRGGHAAVLYRPTSPAGKKPFIFQSPVRKRHFDYVDVEPKISFQTKKGKQDYTLAAAIPWSVLGIKPRPGLKLRGDLGVIFGRETTNYVERIVRWVDKQTNVVNDVPTEAEFFPGRWGTLVLK